jgi:Tfp pilus assembly protein PilN
MINLLAPSYKQEMRAARLNILLLRYVFILAVGIVFLACISGLFYMSLVSSADSAQSRIDKNSSKVAGLENVQYKANQFKSYLSTDKLVFSKSISYSDFLIDFAQAMPSGTVIDSLTLSSATLNKPITITAKARSYNDAINLKNAFNKSSIFSNVSFQSISENKDSVYPIDIALTVTIKKA